MMHYEVFNAYKNIIIERKPAMWEKIKKEPLSNTTLFNMERSICTYGSII